MEPEWAAAPLCVQVRAMIGLPPGPALGAALAGVAMAQVCPAGPGFHAGSALDAAVVLPGAPRTSRASDQPADPSGPPDSDDPSDMDESWGPVLARGARGFPLPGSAPGFPCCCQLVLAAAWEAQSAWTGVQAGRALLSAAGADPVAATPDGFAPARVLDRARDELSGLLRLSPGSVSNRLRAARALEPQNRDDGQADPNADADAAAKPTSDAEPVGVGLRVSALAGLVDEGLLFFPGLRAVTASACELPAEIRAAVHDGVAARIRQRRAAGLESWTAGDLRRLATALALALTPPPDDGQDPDADGDGDGEDGGVGARERALGQRRVTVSDAGDGMAWVSAYIEATDAHRIDNRLAAAAAAAHADGAGRRAGCTVDRHRADVLVATLLNRRSDQAHDPADAYSTADGAPTPGSAAGGPGSDAGCALGPVPVSARPDIHVVIDAPPLVGLAHNPAHVPGLGPIPAPLGRALAAQGRWRLLLADTAGLVTAFSSRTYTPSAAVARLVRAREATCRWPGCTRRSESCDLDHTTAYPDGDTTPANMGPLCRRHHNLKTHHGYTLTNLPPPDDRQREPGNDDDGPPGPLSTAWRWTTPAGLTHTRHPQPPLDG